MAGQFICNGSLAFSIVVTIAFLFNAATSLAAVVVFSGAPVPISLDALGITHLLANTLAMLALAASVWLSASTYHASLS